MQAGAIDLDIDLSSLTDDELLDHAIATCAARDALNRHLVEVISVMDNRKAHEGPGAKNPAEFLAWQAPISIDDARALQLCSRRLRRMPLVGEAFRAGTITWERVVKLASCRATHPDLFAEAEAFLLKAAQQLDDHDLDDVVTYWKLHADPDGAQKDAEARYRARWLNVTTAPDGMVLVNGQLTPLVGAKFQALLGEIERDLFAAEWANAKATHGEATCVEDLERTPRQRSHDALDVIIDRAAVVTPGTEVDHGPRTLLTVLVGLPELERLCQTEAGTILDIHDLLPDLKDLDIERVVFDGPSRVIDVGARQRLFTGATRRAVQVRDRECAHPSCHEPVTYAQIHHVEHYEHGGETTQANAKVYCRWHHAWEHRQDPPAA